MVDELNDIDDIDLDDLINEGPVDAAEILNAPATSDTVATSTSTSTVAQDSSKVRKIKIKKLVKKPVSAPVEDKAQPSQQTQAQSSLSSTPPSAEPAPATNMSQQPDNFDLDSYLDGVSQPEAPSQAPAYAQNLPTTSGNQPETNERPRFINETDLIDNKSKFMFLEGEPIPRKPALIALAIVFFVGFFIAKMFFASEQVVQHGLQGVVANPEVPKGRARCGVAEKTQGCVLYIMNPQRQELNARDFYDLASQLTGRQRFVIETGNMRYASVKIRPGNIVMLNIPPLQ